MILRESFVNVIHKDIFHKSLKSIDIIARYKSLGRLLFLHD